MLIDYWKKSDARCMKNLPRHKLDKWILPGELKHRKRKLRNKRWKILGKRIKVPAGPLSWFHIGDKICGHYETKEEAEEALENAKKDKQWVGYKLEIVKLKRSS